MSKARKIGLLLLGLALVLGIGSCRAMNTAYGLRSSGRELVGRVVERDASAGTVQVQYLVKGEKYLQTFDVDATSLRALRKHAKVDLLYLPDDPDGAVLANDSSLSGSNTILLLLAALGAGALGVVLAITEPGAGNVFRGPRKLPSELAAEEEAGEGEPEDESDEGPAFIGGRPV